MNEKLGFDIIQLIMQENQLKPEELDEAYRVLNHFYSIYREQLVVIEQLNKKNVGGAFKI